MNKKPYSSERGQVLVLIVLAIVGLLGFTALAIDGSTLYSDRRFIQNAADAAALSGASAAALSLENSHVTYSQWNCGEGSMSTAASLGGVSAQNTSAANGIVLDYDISDDLGVIAQCGVDTSSGYADKYLDFHTVVTRQTQTSFLHFVYDGIAVNTVEAVARVRPRSALAYGYAVVALNPASCLGMNTGVEFHGTADTFVNGGGIFSNGCMRGVGNQQVTVTGGSIHYGANFINTGGSTINPAPTKVNFQIGPDAYAIPEPNCDPGVPMAGKYIIDAKDLGKSITTLSPPGLYCVFGDAIINGHDVVVGDAVTVVMVNGRLQIDGGATVKLSAPPVSPDPSPAIPGVVIYAPPDSNYRDINKNGIHVTGNSESYFTGTILAPALDVFMNGISRNEAYKSQIIGWNVQVGGTALTSVLFNENLLYTKPTYIELYR
ncbi:MAG: pilus assembly protein TadG-related protein [Chloroflexota bacterium]